MERESFEDREVAAYLNKHFVSIKVDREERPDIDHVYMTACQVLGNQGGWPLTILMTPEQKPFFAGTYFPKQTMWGRVGLLDILGQVQAKWLTERATLVKVGDLVTEHLQMSSRSAASGSAMAAMAPQDIAAQCYRSLRGVFDREYGGFGKAPKFPTPHNIIFMLRYRQHTGKGEALEALAMAEKTLQTMYRGGIYDHVGFGFARYATDQQWLIPHFEKMLYDNALLAMAFLAAYRATGNKFYAGVARDIFTYILRDMTHPEGGFYSAEDADSEGVEGKFYIWSPAEVKEVLGADKGELFNQVYGITPNGNFEGQSIPNLLAGLPAERAGALGLEPEKLAVSLAECRQMLFAHREKRVHPHKDDKILTAWNGLMIAALAQGAAILQEPSLLAAAQRAASFVRDKMCRADGRLLARYRAGEAAFAGYLDDYAFLIWGLLELYRADSKPAYLAQAVDLTQQTINLFQDVQQGGFFFAGRDAEQLIARPKEFYDGAVPSGNSVMALNLITLAALTKDSAFKEAARHLIDTCAGIIAEQPQAYTYFVTAMLVTVHAFVDTQNPGTQNR